MKKPRCFKAACLLASLLLFIGLAAGCAPQEPAPLISAETLAPLPSAETSLGPRFAQVKDEQPRYVFLFIGDGMGFAHLSLASQYCRELWGEDIVSNAFPVQTAINTSCLDAEVTDSAAAGTALATGCKTNVGMVSWLPDGSAPPTLAEAALQSGRAAGIVTTTALTNATPACFASHVSSRRMEDEIALQMAQNDVDFYAGGGLGYFLPEGADNVKDVSGQTVASQRKDDIDVLERFAKNGYAVFSGRDGAARFDAYEPSEGEKVLACFSASHMPYQADDRRAPSLADMTGKAVALLSRNEKGFFLMVEGGRIDHAAHQNDAAGVVFETVAFAEAIGIAYDFYRGHPDETLIVVTADHETGGLRFGEADTSHFRRVSISVGALQQAYRKDRSAFYALLSKRMGLSGLSGDETAAIEAACDLADKGRSDAAYGGYHPPAIAAAHVLNARAGVAFETFDHTGATVPLQAVGAGSESLRTIRDNAALGRALFEIMGL